MKDRSPSTMLAKGVIMELAGDFRLYSTTWRLAVNVHTPTSQLHPHDICVSFEVVRKPSSYNNLCLGLKAGAFVVLIFPSKSGSLEDHDQTREGYHNELFWLLLIIFTSSSVSTFLRSAKCGRTSSSDQNVEITRMSSELRLRCRTATSGSNSIRFRTRKKKLNYALAAATSISISWKLATL